MKLHNKKSYLVSQKEGRPQKRVLPRITQLLYIIFILLILGYIVYFFFARAFLISQDGIIEVEKQRVAATYGGKIANLGVSQGERFKKGDMLAVIEASRFCRPPEVDAQVTRLKMDISDERIELQGLQRQLALLEQLKQKDTQVANAGIRRALELSGPLLGNVVEDNQDILETQNEIALQKLRIANLSEQLANRQQETRVVFNDPTCSAETIVAQFDGYVFATTFAENEVINRGQTFMTVVANDAFVVAEIYLDNHLYDSALPDQKYTVILPDGYESEASVEKVFTSAITQAERAWDNYSPIIPKLRANLVPVDPADVERWKAYDRYQVKVEGFK